MPRVSGPPIPPGGSADYDFPLRFGGTYWMHSHQGLQEQLLMAAPLIIHDQRDRGDQQEVVVMLTDFSFTPPEQIFRDRHPPRQEIFHRRHAHVAHEALEECRPRQPGRPRELGYGP